jgi:hypothetical protein
LIDNTPAISVDEFKIVVVNTFKNYFILRNSINSIIWINLKSQTNDLIQLSWVQEKLSKNTLFKAVKK